MGAELIDEAAPDSVGISAQLWATVTSGTSQGHPVAREAGAVEGLELHLRPFGEPDLTICDRFVTDPGFAGPFEWTGFGSPAEYRRRWDADGLLGDSPYSLVVAATDDDLPVGWVDWRDTERAGPGVEIGVFIVPEHRGRGAGTAAHRLLVDYLFATTTAHRIWAGTEVENDVEQRALERCGFGQEGLLRGHHYRDGSWRDSYIYGLTRDDQRPRR